jgi:hypothetical protein
MKTFRNRLDQLEQQHYERYIRSLSTEELVALIERINADLLANGWTREAIDTHTEAYIREHAPELARW